jgi:hypothetical protein
MINFNIGDICRIDNPIQKRHGREFEILGFIYDKSQDYPHAPCKLKIKYLDTNRKGTYNNAFESLEVIAESENPNMVNNFEILHH